MSKARGAFVHAPPGGTVADLCLRPACRLNPGRFDRRRAMTAICAFETFDATSRVDVKRSCVQPFLARRMRRRMSNSRFERLR